MEHLTYRLQVFAIVSVLLIISGLIKWFYYRKHKTDKINCEYLPLGDGIVNVEDLNPGFREMAERAIQINRPVTVLEIPTTFKTGKSNTIKLPLVFSQDEINFIEDWYSESGMQQLLLSRGKTLKVLDEKPPKDGIKYVEIEGVPVVYLHRDSTTLKQVQMSELKTVKLLILNEWIK